ncbi:MAG: MFS transporter [Candidatus Tectimicrobiota bacterium]|nr:MAG: MFS transporter [Candidatus Tectomicrobia bacterium]
MRLASRGWLTLAVVGIGVAIGPLDTAVNIAFPAITAAFTLRLAAIQWVIICYVLTYASLLLGCGGLGDLIGHRRVFLSGLWWSALSLLLCSMAPTFGWFLLFRGLQGVGTALVLSCAPALVTLAFAEEERPRVLGLYNMLTALAFALGPLLGGWLVARWGWPAVYTFRVPLAVLSVVLVPLLVPRLPAGADPRRFDLLGATLLALGIAGMLLAFNRGYALGWRALPTLALAATAAASLGIFVRHAARHEAPVLSIHPFRERAFAVTNLAHMLAHGAHFTVFLLVPYYLLNLRRFSAPAGGLLLAMAPLGMVLASPLGGWLLAVQTARRLSLLGLTLLVGGLLAVSQWHARTSAVAVALSLGLQGFGLGLFQVASMDFVMGSLPRSQQGVAGSLSMFTRTLGVVSCATFGSLFFELLQARYAARWGSKLAFLPAFQGVFWGATAAAAAAGLLFWWGFARHRVRRHA